MPGATIAGLGATIAGIGATIAGIGATIAGLAFVPDAGVVGNRQRVTGRPPASRAGAFHGGTGIADSGSPH